MISRRATTSLAILSALLLATAACTSNEASATGLAGHVDGSDR